MSEQLPQRARLDLALAGDAAGPLLCLLIALTGYLAAIGGFALVLLGDDMRDWNRSLRDGLTVQIPADASTARLEMALALLRQTAGIRSARVLETAETARLLEPWLGSAAFIDTLPLPRLVDLQTDPAAVIDFADLRQKLLSIAPGAQLDDHRQWLDNFRSTAIRAESLIALGIAVVVLLGGAVAIFMTRTRLVLHRGAVELFHLLGADDRDIARPFQADALRCGLLGGAIGAAAALVTVIVVGSLLPIGATFGIWGLADWRLWSVAIVVALGAGLVAMIAARMATLRRLVLIP